MRSLKNMCMGYLSYVNEPEVKDALERYQNADNMTDKIATIGTSNKVCQRETQRLMLFTSKTTRWSCANG